MKLHLSQNDLLRLFSHSNVYIFTVECSEHFSFNILNIRTLYSLNTALNCIIYCITTMPSNYVN